MFSDGAWLSSTRPPMRSTYSRWTVPDYGRFSDAAREEYALHVQDVSQDDAWVVQPGCSTDVLGNARARSADPRRQHRKIPEELGGAYTKIAYGYTVAGNDDHFVALAEEHMRLGSVVGAPGRWVVDSLPFLRILPEWFPGAGFSGAKMEGRNVFAYFGTVQLGQTTDGRRDRSPVIYFYVLRGSQSVSTITSFSFAIMMYPVVQHRAQAEVDAFLAAEHRSDAARPGGVPISWLRDKRGPMLGPADPIGLFHCTSQPDAYITIREKKTPTVRLHRTRN
ncbi:hypothetical protein C8R44DRAFT_737850 [Mycena epipterygia]|nr:hypothetical protein C8R44DRAFT_737850 [Mycena epipterygia]